MTPGASAWSRQKFCLRRPFLFSPIRDGDYFLKGQQGNGYILSTLKARFLPSFEKLQCGAEVAFRIVEENSCRLK